MQSLHWFVYRLSVCMVEDETTNATGFMILVGVVLVSVILQFVMFVWFKKKTEEYCGMQLN